jgi:hypothetical protein
MPHPGRIIYHHPPMTHGVKFFNLIYYPDRRHYHLHYGGMDGERSEERGSLTQIVAHLHDVSKMNGFSEAAKATLRALRLELDSR